MSMQLPLVTLLARGEERWDYFWSVEDQRLRYRYEYRGFDDRVFACERDTLEGCRYCRDKWLDFGILVREVL